MRSKIRHQLFLSPALTERLDALAAKPGASKSAILADALNAWLNRRGSSELDDRFGLRLDRITTALGRIERDEYVVLETVSLFVRYMLAMHAPLADNDQAGRALGRQRFDAFATLVGKQIRSGRKTIGDDDPEDGG